MYAMRDPKGFRPLILGKAGNDIIISSESAAIDVLGGTIVTYSNVPLRHNFFFNIWPESLVY